MQLISVVVLGLGISCAHFAIGRHFETLTPENVIVSGKTFYVAYMAWTFGIALVKSAALFFYARIFNIIPSFRQALNLCHALTLIWFVSNLLLIIFKCTPIDKTWYPWKPGTCISLFLWHITEGTFDAVLNLVILVLPMPMVLTLQASWKRRMLLITAFFFGYL